ncbi:filaggrin-2 [Syngnathoides biaculeatus]|uniref:filaggrin-2 n=1 Tax=Syngnathoides biaculeatus TaxID=300417 RepID=UPI002ADE0A46|nr:filaggrin-2 [Syngnathoides biaculeatus]
MCDQQEKVKKQTAAANCEEMKRNRRHAQLKFRHSDEEDGNQHGHWTAEDSSLSDGLQYRRHRSRGYRLRREQSRGRLSPSDASFTSSFGSSSSAFSSSSTTGSSASYSSSSNSSSTTASSSSLPSEISTESWDRFLRRRPQHSQSWTNISGKDGFVEDDDDDDTVPLVGSGPRDSKLQKQAGGKSARDGAQRATRKTPNSASFRKSKSMEALTCPAEKEARANREEDGEKQVRKNVMKEKMKFSAFLNEITRQVLSPMRLSTLGVTDAQRKSGGGATAERSGSNAGQHRSRPVSADSVNSGKYSHASLPKSKSSSRRGDRRSPDSTDGMRRRPRSCTDIDASERQPSRSRTSRDRSHSPSRGQRRRPNRGDEIGRRRRGPSHRRSPRDRSPRRRRGCCSPDRGDRSSSTSRHNRRSPRSRCDDNHGGERCRRPRGYGGRVPHRRECHREDRHGSNPAHRSDRLKPRRPTAPPCGNKTQSGKNSDTSYSKRDHGDHRGFPQHHCGVTRRDHQNRHRGGVHGDGADEFELHRHRDRQRPSRQKLQGHRQRHRGDDHGGVRQRDDDGSPSSYRERRRGARRSPNRPDAPGDGHGPDHEDRRRILHGEDPNVLDRHGRDRSRFHRQHGRGDRQSPDRGRVHDNQRVDHRHPEPRQSRHLSQNESELEDKAGHVVGEPAGGPPPPPQDKKVVLPSCWPDSARKMTGRTGRDEEQTDFTGPSVPQEAPHELDRITVLRDENQRPQQSFVTSALDMECLGEFLSGHKILEEELQRTREELSNLTESFKILHENCSSAQQTNCLLEQKLDCVTRSMEGERQRLSRRISALTEQLAAAKFANRTFGVQSVPNTTGDRFDPDETPPAPPPVQFMDSQSYERVKAAGQDQCLGSVPEEEESDWSETGEQIPRFILTGSNRSQAWIPAEGDTDKDGESGGEEEAVRLASPRPLHVPHLRVTVHNEVLPALPAKATAEDAFGVGRGPNPGSSAVPIRSASLEEIPLACRLRGTEAVVDLRHPGDEGLEDFQNEIFHHWMAAEVDSAPCSLQSVDQTLNRFPREPQAAEGTRLPRSELHGWTEGIAEEVLGGEQTQL